MAIELEAKRAIALENVRSYTGIVGGVCGRNGMPKSQLYIRVVHLILALLLVILLVPIAPSWAQTPCATPAAIESSYATSEALSSFQQTGENYITTRDYDLMGKTYRVRFYDMFEPPRPRVVPLPMRMERGAEVFIDDYDELMAVAYYALWDYRTTGLFTVDWLAQTEIWQSFAARYDPTLMGGTAQFFLVTGGIALDIGVGMLLTSIFPHQAPGSLATLVNKAGKIGRVVSVTADLLNAINTVFVVQPESNELRAVMLATIDLDPDAAIEMNRYFDVNAYLIRGFGFVGDAPGIFEKALYGMEYITKPVTQYEVIQIATDTGTNVFTEYIGETRQLALTPASLAGLATLVPQIIVETGVNMAMGDIEETGVLFQRWLVSNQYHATTLASLADNIALDLERLRDPNLTPDELMAHLGRSSRLTFDFYYVLHEMQYVSEHYLKTVDALRIGGVTVSDEILATAADNVTEAEGFQWSVTNSIRSIDYDFQYLMTLYAKVIVDNAPVYESPGEENRVLYALNVGDMVQISEIVEGLQDWLLISTPRYGYAGYIRADATSFTVMSSENGGQANLQVEQVPERVTRNADWTPVVREFDGVEMVLVPAGCFMMGSNEGFVDEQPVHEVCFEEPFWIDKNEVTNAQFAAFNGQAGRASQFSGDDKPRDNIAWTEARAFCEARGARLPTEAEWEYAARGPDNLVYPWGNRFITANAVYDETSGLQTASVGSRPEGMSWVGALDMAGNVWESVADWWEPYSADRQINPQGSEESAYGFRVMRGGAYLFDMDHLRTTYRMTSPPNHIWNTAGIRCARSFE